jgi:hypothetical protein
MTVPATPPRSRARLITLMTMSGLITLTSIVCCLSPSSRQRARRCAAKAAQTTRIILGWWGVRLVGPRRAVARRPGQHSRTLVTLDLFALVALGLPNTRFFLSGFSSLRAPRDHRASDGTFFTVPQDRPGSGCIFQRALRILQRTGESVLESARRPRHHRPDFHYSTRAPSISRRIPRADRAAVFLHPGGDGPQARP